MHALELVFVIGWAAFWIYWLVAAFSMKKGRILWSRDLRIRARWSSWRFSLFVWERSEAAVSTRIRGVLTSDSSLSRSDRVRDVGSSRLRARLGGADVTQGCAELVTSGA